MSGQQQFDVFLSHNSSDKPAIRRLAKALQDRDLKIWLADGTNYAGQDHLRSRKQRMFEGLRILKKR